MMDQELQLVELSGIGLAGMYAREDGVIIDLKGRSRLPYPSGQVYLVAKNELGKFYSMKKLMSYAFELNPNRLRHLVFKDGNISNWHKDNLEWSAHKVQNTQEFINSIRVPIIQQYELGMNVNDIAIHYKTTPNTVSKIITQYKEDMGYLRK